MTVPRCQLRVQLSVSAFSLFHQPTTPETYTLSLHDALPIFLDQFIVDEFQQAGPGFDQRHADIQGAEDRRSEEHTSELQSRQYLVCRLLLEKKKRREKGSLT